MSLTRETAGLEVIETLFRTKPAPDGTNDALMGFSVEHLFGEVWTRPQLSLRDRELITISVIAAGGWERQLRLHLRGALNAGLDRAEIVEALTHVAYYAGYPAGFTALAVAKEVFAELDAAASPGAPA